LPGGLQKEQTCNQSHHIRAGQNTATEKHLLKNYYMVTVIINGEKELEDFAKEALKIIVNMRETKKFWEIHYGSPAKNSMKCWERHADEFLRKYQVEKLEVNESIKIITA
jgi:transcription antitermination factor NusG